MFSKTTTPEQQSLKAMLRNRAWLDGNFPDVQREYADRWILVLDGRVAAVGNQADDVVAKAGARAAEAIVMRIPSAPVVTPI